MGIDIILAEYNLDVLYIAETWLESNQVWKSVIHIKKGLRFRKLHLRVLCLGDIGAVGIIPFNFMGSVAVLSAYCPPLNVTK